MSRRENWRQQIAADPRAVLPLGIWSGLLLLDFVLWSRWLSGAMTVPLSAPLAWASSVVISAAAVTALVLWRNTSRQFLSQRIWWPEIVTLVMPFLWGLACGAGASPFTIGGLLALWGMVLVSVGLAQVWVPGENLQCKTASDTIASDEPRTADHGPQSTHWQKRLTLPEGEMIEGGAILEFAAGQKEVMFHLAFCPPLSSVPVIHGEDALGGDLEIRTEAVHTFGARLSVRRRTDVETAESREISYAAVPADVQDAAA